METLQDLKRTRSIQNHRGKEHILPGIRRYMLEISRVSYSPGLTQWCTPGHNRSAALRLATRSRV